MLYEQAADAEYRRLYLWLHEIVDRAIARVVEGLHASGMADDTIVVLTSDHGDLLGAHGGLQQKWYNAYDEALRVPLTVCGPDIRAGGPGIDTPTSHVDLLPTLLGLVGADLERVTSSVAERHTETQAPVGRDLSAAIRTGDAAAVDGAPVYFMTEDQISRGLTTVNPFTQRHYEPVEEPANVESVIASVPNGNGDTTLWKLNHYYERLDDWDASVGRAHDSRGEEAAVSEWELHDLTADPEERQNRAGDDGVPFEALRTVLVDTRNRSRRVPTVTNA
jgi:arylsulfatase A-like enzyme